MTLCPYNVKNCPKCGNSVVSEHRIGAVRFWNTMPVIWFTYKPETFYRRFEYLQGNCGKCGASWKMHCWDYAQTLEQFEKEKKNDEP